MKQYTAAAQNLVGNDGILAFERALNYSIKQNPGGVLI